MKNHPVTLPQGYKLNLKSKTKTMPYTIYIPMTLQAGQESGILRCIFGVTRNRQFHTDYCFSLLIHPILKIVFGI